jgi:hypothetical protein
MSYRILAVQIDVDDWGFTCLSTPSREHALQLFWKRRVISLLAFVETDAGYFKRRVT